jgi:hypothetical protein
MEISLTNRISVAPDVLVQELDGESVLLNLQSGRYFGLDQVGNRMWQVLTTAPSVETAYEVLLAEYDVDGDQLRRDLLELADKLVEHGLVAVCED